MGSISNKTRLSAIFVSFTILIAGTASLMVNMSIDYYSVLGTIHKLVVPCLFFAAVGWLLGAILDKPRRRPKLGYTNYFVNELMKKDASEEEQESPAVGIDE